MIFDDDDDIDAMFRRAALESLRLFENYGDDLKDDENVVLKAIQSNPLDLQYASTRLKDDNAIVRSAIQKSGIALQYASPRLRDDQEIVSIAINEDCRFFKYASPRLQKDQLLFEQAKKDAIKKINLNPYVFRELPLILQEDEEIYNLVKSICKNDLLKDWQKLKNLGTKFDQDEEIYAMVKNQGLQAIREDWKLLSKASKRLAKEPEICQIAKEAFLREKPNIKYISGNFLDCLLNDPEIATMIKNEWCSNLTRSYHFINLPNALKTDPDIIQHAKKVFWHNLRSNQRTDQIFWKNEVDETMSRVVYEGNPNVLIGIHEYKIEAVQDDHKIVHAVISSNWRGLKYCSERIRNHKKFVLLALSQNSIALKFATFTLQDDKEFILKVFQQKPACLIRSSLLYVSQRLRNDKDVVRAAVAQCPSALKYASPELRDDPEFQK